MARTRTRANLRDGAKQRADMVNSSFVTDAEWNRWIDLAYQDLYDRLVLAFGFEYFGTRATASTVAGTETVALPTAFYKAWGVSATINGNTVPLDPFTIAERDDFDLALGWSVGSRPKYMIMGSTLLLRPTPDAVYSITYWHCPHATELDDDADTVDGVNGWEALIEIDAAIQALIKEESDPSALMAERAKYERRIETMASSRDFGAPKKVQDVRATRRVLVNV